MKHQLYPHIFSPITIGGGQTGCEVGVHYGMAGKQVTVLGGRALAKDAMRTYREELLGQVNDHCAAAYVGGRCTEITEKGARYIDAEGKELFIEADTVIFATGMKALGELAESFRECAPEFRKIGDCDRVGNVKLATRAAFEAAMTI